MSYENIRLDVADKVATITLARAERMNALTPALFADAGAAVDEALARGARALVLTGEGRAFCSGADLMADAYPEGRVPADLGQLLEDHYLPFVNKVAALDIPVVSAVNGPAVGAGLGLALLGDIVVMARQAYLLLAFVNIGLVPDAGATWLVAKSAGRAKALEMALLGERMSAEEAHAAGLVTRVVDEGEVLAQAQGVAAKLAAGPSVAIGMIRKQVGQALSQSFAESLMTERRNQTIAGATRDFAEAATAFGQKRPPVFEGR